MTVRGRGSLKARVSRSSSSMNWTGPPSELDLLAFLKIPSPLLSAGVLNRTQKDLISTPSEDSTERLGQRSTTPRPKVDRSDPDDAPDFKWDRQDQLHNV